MPQRPQGFHWPRLTAVILACLLLPSVLAAEINATTMLGAEGELYRVTSGLYQDLFEDGNETSGEDHVLALDVTWPDQEAERFLVPGTEGAAAETSPSLVLDRASDTLFVTWEATQTIHSELYVVSRSGAEWADVLEFSGNPFTTKANPRLSVTHERFLDSVEDAGAVTERSQTILHLTWWDQQGSLGRILWAPLVLTDDGLIPIAPVDLASFLEEPLPVSDATPNPHLAKSPYIQASPDQGQVVIAHIDPSSGRLVTLSLQLSGATIDSIGDEARAQVIIFGSQGPTRPQLAVALREQLTAYGSHLTDEAFADYLSQKAEEAVLQAPEEATIVSIAELARAQVIIFGARVRGSLTNAAGEARAQVVIFGDNHPGMEHGRSISITLLDHRELPAIPDEAKANILVSPDGMTMILSWESEGRLVYVESEVDGWGEERSLLVGGDLTLEEAHIILERRLRS